MAQGLLAVDAVDLFQGVGEGPVVPRVVVVAAAAGRPQGVEGLDVGNGELHRVDVLPLELRVAAARLGPHISRRRTVWILSSFLPNGSTRNNSSLAGRETPSNCRGR